jgi:predicted AAA+ superfamily ATPase
LNWRKGSWLAGSRPPWPGKATRFFHYRDKDQVEVDVVAERGASAIAGIEVKASGTVTASDFTGLRRLREVTGSRFKAGVVLYDGETCLGFGDRLFAVPVRSLWENP